MRSQNPKLGYILIVSLIIVCLFCTLSLFYTVLAITASRTAHTWVMEVQAHLLAQSGLEYAVSSIKSQLLKNPYCSSNNYLFFAGEDLNRNGLLDPGEDLNHNGVLDVSTTSLAETYLPSLPILENGTEITVENRKFRVSGILSSTEKIKQVFRLKIVDASSKINISQDFSSLKYLLNNIAEVLKAKTKNSIYDDFVDFKKRNKDKLSLNDLTKFFSAEGILNPSNYFTLQSWYDTKVVIPKPLEQRPAQLKLGQKIFSKTWLFPGKLDLESRPPVNINTANFYVLTAVLSNLQGYYLKTNNETKVPPPFERSANENLLYGKDDLYVGEVSEVSLSLSKASNLAKAIIKYRNEKDGFKTWQEFYKFLLSEDSGLTPLEADLVMANCNPNTDLNKFNPGALIFKSVDKSDLTRYTTEFSLFPTGTFEIESQGLIISDGKILAEASIGVEVKLYDILRDTTQADFSKGLISQASSLDNNFYTEQNKSMEVYPEPKIYIEAANNDNDGQVLLSTLYPKLQNNHTFYASFREDFDADFAKGEKKAKKSKFDLPQKQPLFSGKLGYLYNDGVYIDPTSCLEYSADGNFPIETIDFSKPLGELYKKVNWYSPRLSDIYILYARPMRVTRGAIIFWFKPDYDLTNYQKVASLFSLIKSVSSEGNNKEKAKDDNLFTPFHYFNLFTTAQEYEPSQYRNIGKFGESYREHTGNIFFFSKGLSSWEPTLYGTTKAIHKIKKYLTGHRWIFVVLSWSSTGLKEPVKELEKINFDPSEFSLEDSDERDKNCEGKCETSTEAKKKENKVKRINIVLQRRWDFVKNVSSIFSAQTKDAVIYINGLDVSRNFSFLHLEEMPIVPVDDFVSGASFTIGSNIDKPVWNTPPMGTFSSFEILNKPLSRDEVEKRAKIGRFYNKEAYIISDLKNTLSIQDAILVNMSLYVDEKLSKTFKSKVSLLDEGNNVICEEKEVELSKSFVSFEKDCINKFQGREKLKYKIRFENNSYIYESPVLDDVSLLIFTQPFYLTYITQPQ